LSLVKNILGKKIDKEASGEIHPLTYVEKSIFKKRKILILLLILTLINLSVVFFIEIHKEPSGNTTANINTSVEKKQIDVVVTEKKQQEPEKKPPKLPVQSTKNQKNKAITNTQPALKPQIKEKILTEKISETENSEKVSNFDIFYEKAQKYEKKGDYVSAIFYYRKAYSIQPDEFILYKLGLLHYRIKRYHGASKYAQEVVNKTQNQELLDRAYYLIYKSYEKLGQKKKAKLLLEEVYYRLPESFLVSKALAKLYMKEGNLYAAAEIFETLADKDLESAVLAGKAYEKLGETKLAVELYKKALEMTDGKYKKWLKDKVKLLSENP